MRVYLVGFMGAGKTSVGKEVAARIGYRFLDLDDRIVSNSGIDVRTIFERYGEARFRTLEHEALKALSNTEKVVVATGGGTATQPRNRALMDGPGALSIWLDPSWETIAERLGPKVDLSRPLYASADRAKRLWRSRRDAYRHAGLRVEIGPRETVDEVVDRVVRRLREEHCAI